MTIKNDVQNCWAVFFSEDIKSCKRLISEIRRLKCFCNVGNLKKKKNIQISLKLLVNSNIKSKMLNNFDSVSSPKISKQRYQN